MRPPVAWNFFLESGEMEVPHVLRPEAQPKECYMDGRIDLVMDDMAQVAEELQSYNDEWEHIIEYCLNIFRKMHATERQEFDDKPRN